MVDPLSEVVGLLQPAARFSKLLEGAGAWRIHRDGTGEPFYAAVLEGACGLSVDDGPTIALQAGDFLLAPAMHALVATSAVPDAADAVAATVPVQVREGLVRIGRPEAPVDLRVQIGYCQFAAPDAGLLVSLLPGVVHVRDDPRLAALVHLVGEEARAHRPAREVVLERLLEVLLIEALRGRGDAGEASGLARGLADERLAAALRALHARPRHPWTVAELATEAALSRSAFFARFTRVVGMAPMAYLLTWRMALAKRLLRGAGFSLDQVAERVGYATANTFGTAFTRHVGVSPARYARDVIAPA
ncbi:AraC family transcriptional regulator [Luteimonas sp. TWI1416]|uniref:AraC family transcriptional regulator n=1 Tax=unclassified Luteimonas TaxID=2629088 RepID=UPI00320A9C80